MNLDTLDLAAVDPSGMRRNIEHLAVDAREAFEAAQALSFALPASPRAVALAGMGGSAIAGDLFRGYAEGELRFPFVVSRSYSLPAWLVGDCVLLASSYSGNTEETLAAYAEGRERGMACAVISAGGRLRELAEHDGVPWAPLKPGFNAPRAALAWSFFTLLGVCVRQGWIGARDREVADAVRRLEDAPGLYGPAVPLEHNPAKRLATVLHGSLPVVYTATGALEGVGLRWRQQINENAKSLAHSHVFPEHNHNEIVGSEVPAELLKRVAVVVLRDGYESPRLVRRFEVTRGLISEAFAAWEVVSGRGETLLERMISLVVLGDWMSLYLSFLNRVDPTPVIRIDHLKRELEQAGA